MNNLPPGKSPEAEMDVDEFLHWAELCSRSALVMAPVIWWLQGPSVSTDQFAMRVGLIITSLVFVIGLRIYDLKRDCGDGSHYLSLQPHDRSHGDSTKPIDG